MAASIVVAAVCFTVIIVLLVAVLVLQTLRQIYYAPVSTMDVEKGDKQLKPGSKPTGFAQREVVPLIPKVVVQSHSTLVAKDDDVPERTEEEEDSPEGVVYPVSSYAGILPLEFARMAAVPRIGDWTIAPFNRRSTDLAVARQMTPFGRFRLGKSVESPVKFSSNFEAFQFPKDVWVVYGADRAATVGDGVGQQQVYRLHPLERQYIWCKLLAVTGIAPLVHFLSGETRFLSIAGEMSDRFVIMQDVGIPIKVMFANPTLDRCVEIVRAAIRSVRSAHKMGFVVGSISTSTVFVKGDDVVTLTDFSRAEPIGPGAMTQPWEDVWAAVQMTWESLHWTGTDYDRRHALKSKIKAAVDKASDLAKAGSGSNGPDYDQILKVLGESVWF